MNQTYPGTATFTGGIHIAGNTTEPASPVQQVRITSDEASKAAAELQARLCELRARLLGPMPPAPGAPTTGQVPGSPPSGFLGEVGARFMDVRDTLTSCHHITNELMAATGGA